MMPLGWDFVVVSPARSHLRLKLVISETISNLSAGLVCSKRSILFRLVPVGNRPTIPAVSPSWAGHGSPSWQATCVPVPGPVCRENVVNLNGKTTA